MLRIVIAVAMVGAGTFSVTVVEQYKPYEDDACLTCVCQALGNGVCDSREECKLTRCEGFGPFYITEPYWVTAGSPVQHGDNKFLPGAFKRCVEEPFCAVLTIKNHMSRGGIRDFDKDGRITCMDLHVAHVHGRNYQREPDFTVGSFPYLKKCLKWNETSSGSRHQASATTSTPVSGGRQPSYGNSASRAGGDEDSTVNWFARSSGDSPLQTHPMRPSGESYGSQRGWNRNHSSAYGSMNRGINSELSRILQPRDHFNSLDAD